MIDLTKCKITHYPAEVLGRAAEPIKEITDDIRKLAEKMVDIMLEHKGVGLAGPQAGVPLQIFIISLDQSRESVRIYINPTVTPIGRQESLEEGCLSVPEVYTKISRYEKCKVTATDLDGNEFTEEADGLYARCLQHESDHLNGVTIAERMGQAAKIVHRKQLKKLTEQHNAAKE